MLDIAKAAGVAKSLMYFYFASKEALFVAIVDDVREQLQTAQAKAITAVDKPLERIYVGTAVSVNFVVENYGLYGMINLAATDPLVSKALRAASSAHASDTVREIERGQAAGSIRAGEDPQVMAHANQGVVNHFSTAFLRRQLPGTLDEVAAAAARFVVRGIAASAKHADAVIRSRA